MVIRRSFDPRNRRERYLDTNGDGTGTKIATGDYSDTGLGATDFFVQAPQGKQLAFNRVIIHIADATAPDAGGYGGSNSPLTNGITITIQNNSGEVLDDLTDGLPIKTNAQWGRICYDSTPSEYGQGANYVNVRWTFTKDSLPILLYDRYKLVFTLNDDFSFLTDHTFMVKGLNID